MSKFIVIEGVGGAGKTTQIEKLKEKYPDAVFAREPGGTEAGEKIRNLLFEQLDNLDPVAQLYLVHAARWQNIIENILPALEAGKLVICDRFQLSTFAYQVYPSGREDVLEHILETQAQFLAATINPHYIFLDVSPELAAQRIATGREDDNDTFDSKPSDFQELTYQGYKQGLVELALPHTNIDASQDIESVTRAVHQAIEEVISQDDPNKIEE